MVVGKVHYVMVSSDDVGQRLDNFLMKTYKGIPSSRLYKAIRSGEVRVNGGRVKLFYRLKLEDRLRIPPLHGPSPTQGVKHAQATWVDDAVLYEDERVLVINKPAEMAVHPGTATAIGVVDYLKRYLNGPCYLVHRLDKGVSGCLIVAKSRLTKVAILEKWNDSGSCKRYEALTFGLHVGDNWEIEHDLVDSDGKAQHAKTLAQVKHRLSKAQILWLDIEIETGRKHQIRKHLAGVGMPIIGDKVYGNFTANKTFSSDYGVGMFLHAKQITFWHPDKQWVTVQAGWPEKKQNILTQLIELDA